MWPVPEAQKICNGEKMGKANTEMIILFVKYLQKSKNFKKYLDLTANESDIFFVEEAVESLLDVKRMQRENFMLMENLTRCMESVRLINVVYTRLEKMRLEQFDPSNEHHRYMIEKFYVNMMDNERKNPSELVSAEWLELGFQGRDPSTDFRGMGILGLFQLMFFSEHKKQGAKLILAELSNPARFYPFAIIGINLTRFVMELFAERRLHIPMIETFAHLTVNSSLAYLEGPSNDMDCINFCCDVVHNVYATAFEEFYLTWVMRNPTNVMSFTDLFDEMKKVLKDRHPCI